MSPSASLTTVLTPATSFLLADRAAFKSELQVTGTADDAYIDQLLAQASAAVARHCNRVFPVETVCDEFWPERDPYTITQPNMVTLQSAPAAGAAITADFTYAFVCRFLDDQEDFKNIMSGLWQLSSLKFRSVRN